MQMLVFDKAIATKNRMVYKSISRQTEKGRFP